ncbi:hypothetical protein BC941DRAFT_445765, partial [Chlamydoabsidia padenii]
MLIREENPTETIIEYHWGHTGYTSGSVQDMASAPISRDARLALQKLIENKMTWISIKHLLRQDANQLALIMEMGENANIEESMRLTYQSVYYQMNKTMKSKSQL